MHAGNIDNPKSKAGRLFSLLLDNFGQRQPRSDSNSSINQVDVIGLRMSRTVRNTITD